MDWPDGLCVDCNAMASIEKLRYMQKQQCPFENACFVKTFGAINKVVYGHHLSLSVETGRDAHYSSSSCFL